MSRWKEKKVSGKGTEGGKTTRTAVGATKDASSMRSHSAHQVNDEGFGGISEQKKTRNVSKPLPQGGLAKEREGSAKRPWRVRKVVERVGTRGRRFGPGV